MVNRFLISRLNSRLKNIMVLLFMSMLWHISYGQQDPKVDSLLYALTTLKDDTNKVNLLNDHARRHYITDDFEKAMQYSHAALAIAKNLTVLHGFFKIICDIVASGMIIKEVHFICIIFQCC